MDLMEANGHTGESRAAGAVSIRDLEVAVVLAREMTAASSRAVEASLRADQIQEVFGAAALDDAERARIQTALEMAGLRPTPSLLEVEVGGAVRFAVNPDVAQARAASAPAAVDQPAAAAEQVRKSEFPTVAEFAKTALARLRPPKAAPAAVAPPGAANGAAPTPAPPPLADPSGAPRLDQLVSILIPAVALPVLATSLLGWTFGLPFIALGVILSGRVLGQARAAGATTGAGPVLRGWQPARTALKGIGAVTGAAFLVAVVLAVAIGHSGDNSSTPAAAADFPPAPVTTPLGADRAARRQAREAKSALTRARTSAQQRAEARRLAVAKRRAAAKDKRDKRERDKLIKQGLLNPDGTLTPEGQAQGITPPGGTTQPGQGATPPAGGTTTTQPPPPGTTTTPATTP